MTEPERLVERPGWVDVDTFETFYSSTRAGALAAVLALRGPGVGAEEIVQEAFLRAYRRWSEVTAMDRPDLWVHTVALNLATSKLRRLASGSRAWSRLAGHRWPAPPTPETTVEDIWHLVRQLPRRQGQAVALRYAADLPVVDIAAVLGCAQARVELHLRAAGQTLAQRLEGDGAMTGIEQRSVGAGAELRQVAERRAEAMGEAGAVVAAAGRRGRLWVAGTAAGLALLAVVGVLLTRAGGVIDPASEAASWTWSQLPGGPVDGRHGASVVWADDRLVVWGGEARQDLPVDQGGVYNAAADSWTSTAASPLGPRAGHVAVWTGEQVVMCCGRGIEPDRPRAASYNPADDTWQALPDPPIEDAARMSTAILVDNHVIVLGEDASTGDGNSGVAVAYDLTAGSWRTLAVPPGPIGFYAAAIAAGHHVYVWTDHSGTMAYNLRTDAWSTLPAPPQHPERTDTVWTGTEWLVIGSGADQLVAIAYDPASSAWRTLDVPLPRAQSFEGNLGSQAAVWTGTRLLVYTGALGSGLIGQHNAAMLSYDPATDTWDRLPDAPASAYNPPLLWTGTEALLYSESIHALQPHNE